MFLFEMPFCASYSMPSFSATFCYSLSKVGKDYQLVVKNQSSFPNHQVLYYLGCKTERCQRVLGPPRTKPVRRCYNSKATLNLHLAKLPSSSCENLLLQLRVCKRRVLLVPQSQEAVFYCSFIKFIALNEQQYCS